MKYRYKFDNIKQDKIWTEPRKIGLSKRIVSVSIAVSMLFSSLPLSPFQGCFDFSQKVYAANADNTTQVYPNVYPDASRTNFYSEENHAYMIYRPADLVTYSQAYYSHAGDHQEDTIVIAYQGFTYDALSGFFGLGTESCPFKGTIKTASASNNKVNIPEAFFDYVYDSVQIISDSSNEAVYLQLTRTGGDNSGEPVLAKHVLHDTAMDDLTDEDGNDVEWTGNDWRVLIDRYYDGSQYNSYSTGSIIGEICANAIVNISVEDNNGREIYAKPLTHLNGNVGRICGTMKADSSLTVNACEGTNTDYSISTTNGNAGGVVGEMESGSTLTLNSLMANTAPSVTADGEGKYAGGIVGYNDRGSVIVNTTSSTTTETGETDEEENPITQTTYTDIPYTVGGTMAGTTGAGGVFGYFCPDFEEDEGEYSYRFDVSKFTISTTANGNGSCGGLFGLLDNKRIDEDTAVPGGTINIIASDSDNKTVTSSHSDGDTANYGGLIGKYSAFYQTEITSVLNIGLTENETDMFVSTSASSSKYSNYGGAIGYIETTVDETDMPAYVKFNGFTTSASGGAADSASKTFGGIVGNAGNAFVDANNVTVSASGFHGGGVIGWIDNGILRLSGTTDLHDASASIKNDYYNGQIVGYRDNSLIFAEKDWVLIRNTSAAADDIGSWGEVLRFDSYSDSTSAGNSLRAECYSSNAVLTVNETKHTVEISAPVTSIGTKADFARTALCFQIDATAAPLISFASGSAYTYSTICNQALELTSDIVLTNTGLTGFTRDNGTKKYTFNASLNGKDHSITLAIGEPYGFKYDASAAGGKGAAVTSDDVGCGRIYRHKYNGLLGTINSGVTNGGAIKNIEFLGSVDVNAQSEMYVGAAAAIATGTFTALNVIVGTSFKYAGSSEMYLGRLIGDANSGIEGISITKDSTTKTYGVFSGDVIGDNSNNDSCYGGVIGRISQNQTDEEAKSGKKNLTWNISDVKLKGTISNTSAAKQRQQVGGLIALITNNNNSTRTLNLSGIETSGLVVSGKTSHGTDTTALLSTGGLLGYGWYRTNVNVIDVDISADGTKKSKVVLDNSVSDYGDFGGLIYNATGTWNVTDIDINSFEVTAGNAKSFGLIVNKGWAGDTSIDSAIYLCLNNDSALSVTTCDLSEIPQSGIVFDELCAYSAFYNEDEGVRTGSDGSGTMYVLQNGQGVVSVHTSAEKGLVMDGTNNSLSYQQKTGYPAIANPWTRYYYNLNDVTVTKEDFDTNNAKNDSDESKVTYDAQVKLMSWALNKYAHSSIKSNFADPFGSTITAGDYNMTGYSWYPVDLKDNITLNGTFTFANEEFEKSEDNYSYARSSLHDSEKSTTQHYLLHEGLFRNVNSCTLTVGNVTFKGNIAALNATSGTGVLVFDTLKGSDATTAIINSKPSENATSSIVLDGIHVYNYRKSEDVSDDYAPLLINKVDNNSSLYIYNVSVNNTGTSTSPNSWYKSNISTVPYAATSLIGHVGLDTSAKSLHVEFGSIKLDGRIDYSNGTLNEALDTIYPTTHAIFSKSTLLDWFQYTASSDGFYDYNIAEDWTSGSHSPANVTYGSEISDNTKRNQYFGQEFWYKDTIETTYTNYASTSLSGNGKDPDTGAFVAPVDFSGFLPYVYDVTTKVTDKTVLKKHQLKVNHGTAALTGCGTYNDPYLIATGDQLNTIANILNGVYTGTSVILPNVNSTYSSLNVDWLVGNGSDKGNGKRWDNYGHSTFKYNGSNYQLLNPDTGAFVTSKTYTTTQVRRYLAGAYYKLEDNITLDSEFPGLGYVGAVDTDEKRYSVFHGVIFGDGKSIKNNSQNPLIATSYGSVVKDVIINVDADITRTQSESKSFNEANDCANYGAVIGQILGGDNIIDEVRVSYGTSTITLSGDWARIIPVGGYVGVVVNGALIFRGMESRRGNSLIAGLSQNSTVVTDGTKNDLIKENNTKWLYVNPIIGRVINGYAVTETTTYRPFEDGTRSYASGSTVGSPTNAVTMRNSNKNYSIADINKNDTGKIDVSAYTETSSSGKYETNIEIGDGQSLFLFGALTWTKSTNRQYSSDKTKMTDNDSYTSKAKTTHIAQYDHIGYSEQTDDYLLAAKDTYFANTSRIPYVVGKYTNTYQFAENDNRYGIYYVSNSYTVCNITLSKNGSETQTFTLPDGFKGIGGILTTDGKNAGNYISLHKFDGNGNVVDLGISLQYYKGAISTDQIDNYYPQNNNECGGVGLFNILRQNRSDTGTFTENTEDYQIQNLTLSGNVSAQVYKEDGDILGYDFVSENRDKQYNIVTVGALAGYVGCGWDSTVCIKNVTLDNLNVFSPKTAGGLIGYAVCNNKTLSIYNCDADKLIVSAGQIAGGLVGGLTKTVANINGDIAKSGNNSEIKPISINIISTLTGGTGIDHDYNVGKNRTYYAGGVIGQSFSTVTIRNINVGKLDSGYSGFIGNNDRSNDMLTEESPEGTVYEDQNTGQYYIYHNPKKPWSIVGGMIAASDGQINTYNCNTYNISMYGGFCGGMCGRPQSAMNAYNCNTVSTQSEEDMSSSDGRSPYMITAWYGVGGIIGETRYTGGTDLESCKTENYIIRNYSEDNKSNLAHAGGLVGRSNGGISRIRNSSVINCYIEGRKSTSPTDRQEGIGCVIGVNEKGIQGYNILINDCKLLANSETSFEYKIINQTNNNIIQNGYLGGNSETGAKVAIAGLSLQISDDNNTIKNMWYTYLDDSGSTVVLGPSTTNAVDSYIVNSDYDGACMFTSDNGETYPKRSATFAPFKDDTDNVKDNTSELSTKPDITDNDPYVTSSQKVMIDPTNFLTSDAMASLTFDGSIAKEIVTDYFKDSSTRPAKYYQNIQLSFPGIFAGNTTYNKKMYNLSDKPNSSTKFPINGRSNMTELALVQERFPELYVDENNTAIPTADYPTWGEIYLHELDLKYTTYQAAMEDNAGVTKSYNFPVLVIDDSNSANVTETINNYIRILTNTNFNYAKKTLSNNSTSASTVFEVSLAKCTYEKSIGKFVADYSEGECCLKNDVSNGYFKIENEYDNSNQNGQFSLIDIKFLDPSNNSGDTKKVAYHVYIPVVVKKMLRYDFEASFLSGSNYRIQPYKVAPRGNTLIENLGNPVTLECRWIYRRNLTDWLAEMKNGECLLHTYNKTLLLNDHTGYGLPAGTKMTMVDANNNNKSYYALSTDEGVYTSNNEDRYLKLNNFKTADGNTSFKSVLLNDFFSITGTTNALGNYIRVAANTYASDEAAVTAGYKFRDDAGNYYRPYNPDSDGNSARYNVTINYKSGVSETYEGETYLVEDYYITFYTQSADDTIYHLAFSTPKSFGDDAYPSDIYTQGSTDWLTGDIYQNTLSIVGNQSADVEINKSTSSIGATFNADIKLTDTAAPIVASYLSYNSVNIYQSFLVNLNRQEAGVNARGIKTIPTVRVSAYTVGTKNVKSQYEAAPADFDRGTITNNYIELRNNENLKTYLLRAYNSDTTNNTGYFRISATFSLDYTGINDTETENKISAQFPTRDTSSINDHTIGTKIGGSSNISSSPNTTASSKTSISAWWDTMYFTRISSSAELIYSSDDAENINGEFAQLGINARELSDTEASSGVVHMKTLVTYKVGKLDAATSAGSMKLTLNMSEKGSYGTPIPIYNYIKDGTLKIYKDGGVETLELSDTSTNTNFEYIINTPMSAMNYDSVAKTYYIPIEFDVYTGNNANFETANRDYANYMVQVQAELFTGTNAVTANYIDGSRSADHVIYTNAKIISSMVS